MVELSLPKIHRKHSTQVLLNCIFVSAVPFGAIAGKQSNQLQQLLHRAARIVTKSSFDGPSKLLFYRREWKTIEECTADETTLMIFKSLHDIRPQYMYKMFTKNSNFIQRNIRNTITDLRFPLRNQLCGRNSSHTEVPRCGIASQLSAKKQGFCLSSNPF